MQAQGAYVDQIPAGVKPPTAAPPALRITPNAGVASQRPPPPGLYVRIATVQNQEQALHVGMAFAQSLGANRPPFIRGEAQQVDGRPGLGLFAGPFASDPAARRFCEAALAGQVCTVRIFAPLAAGRAPPGPAR